MNHMRTDTHLNYPRFFLGCGLAALLCSCSSTSIKKTSKSPDFQGAPRTRIAVLTVDDRGFLRQSFESRFAVCLQKRGAAPITTFNLMPLADIARDKPAAAERLKKDGCDSVLICRLYDTSSSFREVRPGAERYTDYISGVENVGWYDYYSVAFMDMSPTYGNQKQQIHLETVLFDLNTTKRLWSAMTLTVFVDGMDGMEEMDKVVAKVLSAMHKDKVGP